jgi:hypothetical protein
MLEALSRVHSLGELFIPWGKPAALRLQFYGLARALRSEGKPEIVDSVGFYVQTSPPGLILRLKDSTDLSAAISGALEKAGESLPSETLDAENLLSRILERKTA